MRSTKSKFLVQAVKDAPNATGSGHVGIRVKVLRALYESAYPDKKDFLTIINRVILSRKLVAFELEREPIPDHDGYRSVSRIKKLGRVEKVGKDQNVIFYLPERLPRDVRKVTGRGKKTDIRAQQILAAMTKEA